MRFIGAEVLSRMMRSMKYLHQLREVFGRRAAVWNVIGITARRRK